jgi:hypothetical protein
MLVDSRGLGTRIATLPVPLAPQIMEMTGHNILRVLQKLFNAVNLPRV